MKVHLLTVGDELLIGQVINSNASWLGEQLTMRGGEVVRMVTVPDELPGIVEELRRARSEADLLIVTGGLGPTHDDLTRDAIAKFLDVRLRLQPGIVDTIRARFSRRNKVMPDRNQVQAMVPEGCEVLPNAVGTAPGLWYQEKAFMMAVLPGVPHEMKTLMQSYVFERIERHERVRPLAQRTLLTTGIGESDLQERLGAVEGFLNAGQKLAYLPNIGGVRLRITAFGQALEEAVSHVAEVEAYIRGRLSGYIFGVDDESLEGRIGVLLNRAGLTVSTAESCTGGLIGDRITRVSGSSAYFKGASSRIVTRSSSICFRSILQRFRNMVQSVKRWPCKWLPACGVSWTPISAFLRQASWGRQAERLRNR